MKSWVLLADYKDCALERNSVAFYLGQQILGSDGYYCSDFRQVEVYLNNLYWGVYLLAEQQQVNANRINVTEPDDNYTGTDIGFRISDEATWEVQSSVHNHTDAVNQLYSWVQARFKYLNSVWL